MDLFRFHGYEVRPEGDQGNVSTGNMVRFHRLCRSLDPEGDQGKVTEIPESSCVTIPGSGPNLDQQLVQ